MTDLLPREIVSELDRHIVGQADAKRKVALALRQRFRRRRLEPAMRDEIVPRNLLMIGPTGVGKTEIARRLARLAKSPFVKVEATKFTEVGYVGRDVEQIIRDLLEMGLTMVRDDRRKAVRAEAHANAEARILKALVGSGASAATTDAFRKRLRAGDLDDKEIDIEIHDDRRPLMPSFDIPGLPGAQMGMINIGEMIGKSLGGGKQTRKKRIVVTRAHRVLIDEESDKLIDQDAIVGEAIDLTENDGIVFIDEIDKICARSHRQGGDVSREGVQRDLLPLIEGTAVATKHGMVKTDHILFIASGAFHVAKPGDLLPELQGRLPIRVELSALGVEDFKRILTEPEASLVKQAAALMGAEGVELDFTEDGVEAIARIAADLNRSVENIGARRLQTVLERVLEDISFAAGESSEKSFVIDAAYVERQIGDLIGDADLSRFIL